MMPDMVKAAKMVVGLDTLIRQYPGQPTSGSTRNKKNRARLNGALLVWEALTDLPPGEAVAYAYEVVRLDNAAKEN